MARWPGTISKPGLQNPPGFRGFAIGDETFVKNDAALDAVGPLALIVERIGGGQKTGTGDDSGWRRSVDDEKFAFFGSKVVFGVVGVENVAGGVMNQVNVTARVRPRRVFIEIDFVGSDGHFRSAYFGGAFQVFPLAL
jgi:hypothetical protein